MKSIKLRFTFLKFMLALSWLMLDLTLLGLPIQGQGKELSTASKTIDTLIFNESEPQPSGGAPGRRTDPGRRGGDENFCQSPSENSADLDSEELSLIAVAPPSVRGLTVEERPTFWFYIPFESNPNLSAEFSLSIWQNTREGQRIYEEIIPITGGPGLVSFRLPPTVAALEEGTEYRFVFTIVCNPNRRIEDIFVNGFVRRIALNPTLQNQLEAATPVERAALYAQAGIWQETITSIGDYVRRTNDPAAASLLTDLLESVGLAEISRKSVVDCCSPRN